MDEYAGHATGIGGKPTALDCSRAGCDRVEMRVIFNRIHHVCGECALIINSLIDCPLRFPYPDRVNKQRKHRNQTKQEMQRQIKMAEIRKGAREYSYGKNINRLIKEYK